MTRYPQQASHFYSFIMPDYPSYQRFIVGTEDAIPEVRQPSDSSKINAVAKEMENLRQSLDELRVKRDIAMAEAGIPRGTGMGYGGCGGGGHMGMGHW